MERLPGFRDFYPEPLPHQDAWSCDARRYLFDKWREVARRYGFREYDGPPLEALELFTKKSGEEIVGQLYSFEDKGGRNVAMRPEMTPTLARMAAAHQRNYKKPIKWFAIPQLFRYERQQKGRLREHFQLNADIIGESDAAADAELMALLVDVLRSVNLTAEDFVLRISSRNAWHDFYRRQGGQPESEHVFYQVIDKMEREPPEQSKEKLGTLGFSMAAVNEFIEAGIPTPDLESIIENLAARGMEKFAKVDYRVIRGLAYYTGTVFEAFDCKGEFRAIAGGGRYDNLVQLISGGKVALPALGFGMGDVVLLELLKSRGLLPSFGHTVDVYFVIVDEKLRSLALELIQSARAAGHSVEFSLTSAKKDKQLKRALELKSRKIVLLETGADGEPLTTIRDSASKAETSCSPAGIAEQLAK